jgi:hypothetical protein
LALTLGACSASELLPKWMSDDTAGPEPAYRWIIAGRLKDIVGDPASAGVLQISGLRRIDAIKGASWVVCLKVNSYALSRYYAVFIQQNRIVDSRLSVLIDQCEIQSFSEFDWGAEIAKGPPPG